MVSQSPVFSISKLDAELCRRDFFFFLQTFWEVIIPEDPIYNWHMEYICQEIQTAGLRVINRENREYDLVINVPPGTSKSTICTVMFPIWLWINDPTIKIMTASYSGGLSGDHSLKSRDIIRSEKFKMLFPEIEVRKDVDGKTHFANTQGGERYATSVRGTATGKHAHVIIVDDPLDPRGAESEADRLTANNFMNKTLPTRKINKSVALTVLVMQRLHVDDCTGIWLEQRKDIKHICLPAELSKHVKPEELSDRYIDGLLDNKRLAREELDSLKDALGSYAYAGQMMQLPAPDDGGIWSAKWFIALEDVEFEKLKPKFIDVGSDWDLAYTKHDKNSASGFITAGRIGNDMYIDNVEFQWLEFPELINWMAKVQAPHYIEAKASGISASQVLRKHGIIAIEVSMGRDGDKVGRTRLVSKYAEAGHIYVRRSVIQKLLYDTKQGIVMFPNNANNDINDALVQAINRLLAKPKARSRHSNLI